MQKQVGAGEFGRESSFLLYPEKERLEATCSKGVVLVKPRAVTRGPPTVGPRKFPRAKAAKKEEEKTVG